MNDDKNRTNRIFKWINGIINDYNAEHRIEIYPIYQLIKKMLHSGKSSIESEYKFDYEHYRITITLEKLNDKPTPAKMEE